MQEQDRHELTDADLRVDLDFTQQRHAVQLGVETQVLRAGQVVIERGVLEDQADIAADRVPLGPDVAAGHPGVA